MRFKAPLTCFLFLMLPVISIAKDYKVEIFEEHYKEKLISGGGEVKIYHTWQVKTIFGNKLLVLVGNDYDYRKWVRESLKKHILFIIKIPDQGDQKFENDLAVIVDIQQVHPIWEDKWNCEGCRHDTLEEGSEKF